jgi:hypothetical protein
MDGRIEKIKKVRRFLMSQIEGLSDEQLNKPPDGFNNNVIWNLARSTVSPIYRFTIEPFPRHPITISGNSRKRKANILITRQ